MFYISRHSLRAGQTHQWCPPDTEDSYKPIVIDSGMPNYTKDAFNYKFNNDGFRCDDFSSHSDYPVVFSGCSFTEGIGLPVEEIWTSHILARIRNLPQHAGKSIPYWSVALGATGIDTAANVIYSNIDKLKPKVILMFLNSFYRRDFSHSELLCGVKFTDVWVPNFVGDNPIKDEICRLFTDDYFALHQTYRSLQLLDASARFYDTNIFLFKLITRKIALIDDHVRSMMLDFPRIQLIEVNGPPPAIRNFARDNKHPGPDWHVNIANKIWEAVKDKFN